MIELIQTGGPVMYVLTGFSVVALTFILERFWALHRVPKRQKAERFLGQVEEAVKQNGKRAVAEQLARSRGYMNYMFAGLMRRHDELIMEERSPEDMRDELAVTADEASQQYLGRFLGVLATIGTVSPLLGLLGTILGMITAFSAIARAGTGDPQVVASGISQALFTTAAGLIIAVPTIILHRYLASRADREAARTELYFRAFANTLIHSES